MRKFITYISPFLFSVHVNGQLNNDFLIPHFNAGKGLGEMSEIISTVGFGYDIGYDIPSSSFGLSAFFNFNRIGRVKEKLPMYRDIYGIETVDVVNSARINAYGVKFKYSPRQLHYHRVLPFIEMGVGRATHSALWRSNLSEPSLDYYHLEYFDYVNTFKQREILHRNKTNYIMGEIGLLICLYSELETKEQRRIEKNRNGWYLGLSVRVEKGGAVTFRNPKHNSDHFYFDSGLGTFSDYPFNSQNFPFDDSKTYGNSAHHFIFFQVSLMHLIF